MDVEDFFKGKFENMLMTGFRVKRVKDLLNLEGISPVWEETPAWYVWVSSGPGVYHIGLTDFYTNRIGKHHLLTGIFSIKCYPFVNNPIFRTFSTEERLLIQSDCFDHTNTPVFEKRHQIPESLFNVAYVAFSVDTEETLALFTLEGPDALRISYHAPKVQPYTLPDQTKTFNPGDIDRNVPGWDIGFSLFDRLISLYSFCNKQTPCRTRFSEGEGFEYVYTPDRKFECKDSNAITILKLDISFTSKALTIPDGSTLDALHPIDNSYEIIFDNAFHCAHCHHDHGSIEEMAPRTNLLNETWWSLANWDDEPELTSLCGCCND